MTQKKLDGAGPPREPRRLPIKYAGALLGLALATTLGAPSLAAAAAKAGPEVVVRKSRWCGCCGGWVAYLRENGFKVVVKNIENLEPYKKLAGVPEKLKACHTAVVSGYVVEGHVPVASIRKLLAEKPEARGIAVPGMPTGVPGMGGERKPFTVFIFDRSGKAKTYAEY